MYLRHAERRPIKLNRFIWVLYRPLLGLCCRLRSNPKPPVPVTRGDCGSEASRHLFLHTDSLDSDSVGAPADER